VRSSQPESVEKFFCPFANLKFEKIRDLRTKDILPFLPFFLLSKTHLLELKTD